MIKQLSTVQERIGYDIKKERSPSPFCFTLI